MEIINNFFLNLQKNNPLNLCWFYPVDPRKYVLICKDEKLYFMKRKEKLDLVCLFKPTCLYCISMFISMKFIPHFAKEAHSKIPLHETAYFNKYYMRYKIKEMIIPGRFEDSVPFISRHSKSARKKAFSEKLIDKSAEKEDIKEEDKKEEVVEKIIIENKPMAEENPVKLKGYIDSIANDKNKNVKNLIIASHPLNKAFSKGAFFNFKIDIRNVDGYVRANSIRENAKGLNENDKMVAQWKKNKKSQEFVIALSIYLNIPVGELIIEITDVCNDLRGIYIHPKLIIDYASWISSDFKIYTQEIVLEFFNNEAEKRLQDKLKRSKEKVKKSKDKAKKKEDKIDRLLVLNEDLKKEVSEVRQVVTKTDRTLNKVRLFIENRVARIGVDIPKKYSHIFVIWRLIPNLTSAYTGRTNCYCIARIMISNYIATKKRQKLHYDSKLKTVYNIASPNPIELSLKVKKIEGIEKSHSLVEMYTTEVKFLEEVKALANKNLDDYITVLEDDED